jgi:alpha-D-ribose 1-methylphosphonate 5-triphosphate synthase subunit PhnH
MARPGTIHDIGGAVPPAPLSVAAGAAILTLCDPETPIYLAGEFDVAAVRDWITFQTGAPFVAATDAMFAVGHWADMMPMTQFAIGTPEYPDRSATLIVEMSELSAAGATLSGPGIKETTQFSLPETDAFQANAALFPLGLDFIFTAGTQIAALPRTTQVR